MGHATSDRSGNKSSSKASKRVWRWFLNLLVKCVLNILFVTVADLSLKNTRRVARFFGRLAELFLSDIRRTIDANLAIAFPEMPQEERRALRRRNLNYLVEFGLDFLSMLKNPRWASSKFLLKALPPELDEPEQAVLWNLPHLGNWEVLAQQFPTMGHRAGAVVADFSLEVINKLIVRCRTLNGMELEPQQGGANGLRRMIEQGMHAGMLIDQNTSPRHGGRFIPFFGLPAATSRLAASVGRKYDCRIGIIACTKREDGKFEVSVRALPHRGAWYSDDDALTAELLRCDEDLIRNCPEQYLWLYKRWKYKPANGSEDLKAKYPFYATHDKFECSEEILESGKDND